MKTKLEEIFGSSSFLRRCSGFSVFFQKIIAAPDQVLKNCVDASVLVGILNVKAHKRARKFRDSFNFQHLKDVL